MKKFIIGFLAVVGALAIVFCFLGLFGLILLSLGGEPGVPRSVVLEVDFEAGVLESVPNDAFAQYLHEDQLTVRDLVDALARGAEDRRVKGLIARVGGGVSMAHTQEIRDAVARFSESGKPTLAFAESFGEFGPGNSGYYLATAFEDIYLQPSGDVGLTGLIMESMFLRGLLEKLEVVPQMDHRYEYKNALNQYTEKEYTPAHREAMSAIVTSLFGQMTRGIAEGREMTEDEVRDLIDGGPYFGVEALDARLVDGLAYYDEVYAMLTEETGDDVETLDVLDYLDRAGRPKGGGPTVALIQGLGGVTRGSSGYSPWSGESSMGSDTIAAAFRDAIDDKRVKAIVFRVDSPGGSYVASDTIWRETIRAKEAGKPVIVSMGRLAASGGYFVAMDADKIVAQPATITASIGVLAGKMVTRGVWERAGISFDEVHSGANATQWTARQPYSDQGYERLQASLDRIYEDFTMKVAEGRGLPLETVQEIARGRIWSGEDALELGLVDALGGLDTALQLAKASLDLEPDDSIRIRRFPAERSAFDLLFGGAATRLRAALPGSWAQAVREAQPHLGLLERGVAGQNRQVLSMPQTPIP
ncbi:MAG: signal peptide peptidase SppA [bacterium]|nr:signal peptide peptidase SppA [bacterium]